MAVVSSFQGTYFNYRGGWCKKGKGIGQVWSQWKSSTGSIRCANGVFGDNALDTVKYCECKAGELEVASDALPTWSTSCSHAQRANDLQEAKPKRKRRRKDNGPRDNGGALIMAHDGTFLFLLEPKYKDHWTQPGL
jgi:hypothetical protein